MRLVLTAVVLLVSTRLVLGGPPVDQTEVPKALTGLPERWLAAMDQFQVPGFAVIVVEDDKVIYRGCFGYRDVQRRLPVTPDTAFYIASCTKPFTAMGVLKLVADGKLGLDDPVVKHLPRLELPEKSVSDKLTVRDLLCHRYGISCGPAVLLDAYTGEITEDRYYHFLKTRGEVRGSVMYSNVHFTLAGRVISAVTGRDWRDHLAESIFKPAGMTTATGYADEMYRRPDVAVPYQLGETSLAPAPRKTDRTMHAAGGLGMSIEDLGRWLRLNINRGEIDGKRIIPEELMDQMVSLQSESRQGRIRIQEGFGLGWVVGTFRSNGPRYIIHSGGYIGAGAHTSFLPDRRIGVAVVTNGDQPAGAFAEQAVSIDILDRLVGGEHPDFLAQLKPEVASRIGGLREQRRVVEADVAKSGALSLPSKSYAGRYANDDFGTVTVTLAGNHLRLSLGEMPVHLVQCVSDQFTARDADDAFPGRFEIENGKPAAVILQLQGSDVKFVRE